jgi:hypothetical protein
MWKSPRNQGRRGGNPWCRRRRRRARELLGVCENPDKRPEHMRERTVNAFKHSDDARGD